ncbi:MAG TPA: hypothetical protein VEY12_00990 [Thermoplasmata archaeon]|nr:hypothetical protein [Thermoplasmata archaeon]
MPNPVRTLGIASVVVGAVLTGIGALDFWVYLFWRTGGNAFCSGNTCYQIIAEPPPWYYAAVLPAGLAVLVTGILLVRRGGRAASSP